jgi:regulator of PEP synthase PpsR (kinase-PPPase family)
MATFNLHMVSDLTGETVRTVARAALVQFEQVDAIEHLWSTVRNLNQLNEVLSKITEKPGFVLYTLVNADVRYALEEGCRRLNIPRASPMSTVVKALGDYLGVEARARPGRQHIMDAEYLDRIEAMHYVLAHDDGQQTEDLVDADGILLGVSRTSKTPTCMYLANRGTKAANVPIIPDSSLPAEVFVTGGPLVIGLTNDPKRLVQLRRNRMRFLRDESETDYVKPEQVAQEVSAARRLFARNNWPVIDVTRRSVEKTAATIMQLLKRRKEPET